MTKVETLIKQTGATFTPSGLAEFLSEKIVEHLDDKDLTILDPACGEGALLDSISKQLDVKNISHKLIGYDSNRNYLNTYKQSFKKNNKSISLSLINEDFLESIEPEKSQLELSFEKMNESNINNSIDAIIANPPYVRTQILGSDYAQILSKKFNLKGRVDLYYPFLIAMTHALKKDGILGVITSNRYLLTKSGNSVRKFLEENYEILEIIDLGDTKLFDAAVLPAIFIGKKKENFKNTQTKFSKIYQELNGYKGDLFPANGVYDILSNPKNGYFVANDKRYKKSSGEIKFFKTSKENIWTLLSKEEAKWIESINSNSKNTVGDYFKVRVGIKTTADKVFISDKWQEMGSEAPEKELLRDLISQQNIKTWNLCDKIKLKVLYPHFSKNGKKETIILSKFPKAKNYLELHKTVLENRKYLIDAGRKWFELWVPQNPLFWKMSKLVFPDISSEPRFYFDESGKIVNGNCYWIVAQNEEEKELLFLIQGVANSKLMTKYHDLMFNNKLYSGKRRYFSQYVQKYPLPDIKSKQAQKIIDISKLLNSNNDEFEKTKLIEKLEIAVAKAFKVSPIFNLD